jgi:hypothetical protein
MLLLSEVGFKYPDQLVAAPALRATYCHHLHALALLLHPFQHSSKLLWTAMYMSHPLKHICASLVLSLPSALSLVVCSKLTTFLAHAGRPIFLRWPAAALQATAPGALAFLPSAAAPSMALH